MEQYSVFGGENNNNNNARADITIASPHTAVVSPPRSAFISPTNARSVQSDLAVASVQSVHSFVETSSVLSLSVDSSSWGSRMSVVASRSVSVVNNSSGTSNVVFDPGKKEVTYLTD